MLCADDAEKCKKTELHTKGNKLDTKKNRPAYLQTDFVPYVLEELLLLCVSLIEFVNATCSVDELHLTSVEWVRCVRDLKLYYRVLNALDFDGLLSVRA